MDDEEQNHCCVTMDDEEQNRYVAQLREEFDSCDTTGTGYLDKDELTVLCHKLHLDAHLPLLLDSLLGPHPYARVNFQEFKEGFVAVLSRSLDYSTSEEESSYLQPVVPEEVKPKFVKGTKRYGRRTRPERPGGGAEQRAADSEDSPPSRTEPPADGSPVGARRRGKLRRSTSLESVESLKSDEEAGSPKDTIHQNFEAQGQQKRWKPDSVDSPLLSPGRRSEVTNGQMRAVWAELGVGGGGFLSREELSLVCEHLGFRDLPSEELDALFRKLDADVDGRVSLREIQNGLFPPPTSTSTPTHPNTQRSLLQALEERPARSASPSLLSATVGQRLLSRLDDGSGCTSPERVMALWTEEGIRNSRDILQTLDFPLEERLSLAELTLALDNELLVSGNGIHQAALISYKNEIHFLQVLAEQASRERDKVKADLEWADRRNLQLVSEVDDRHATMESLNQTKIRDLEQVFRDRLTALRSESEQDSEVLLEQVEQERDKLQQEVGALRAQETSLQEEVCNATQERSGLEEELTVLKQKLTEAESSVARLQGDLDQLLQDKLGSLCASSSGLLSHEERFGEIVKEYDLQCRELRDRNDELSSELEMLKNQTTGKRSRRERDDTSTHTWTNTHSLSGSDSDDPDMKRGTSPLERKKLQVSDKHGLGSLEGGPGRAVSIETELAMEQLRERHSQELQDLNIQLETKVNFYERNLELMRRSMEVERKDISQGFKVEISELEEQKAQAEEQAGRLREALERLQQQGGAGGGAPGWGSDQERRAQRERAEMEQNFAREISNLVQRLTSEKDQLEAEMKLRMDQEVLLVREELEQERRRLLHQLHCERLQELEQEQERQSQEQRASERTRLIEQHQSLVQKLVEQHQTQVQKLVERHQTQVQKLEQHISSLQEQAELAPKAEELFTQNMRSEAKLGQCETRCSRLESDVEDGRARCRQLEAELKAAVVRLAEEAERSKCSEEQRRCERRRLEEELQGQQARERELLDQASQAGWELDRLQAQSEALLRDKEIVAENCGRLSAAFVRQQAQLGAREQNVDALRGELEKTQEALRRQSDGHSGMQAELDSLRADRAKLIQDLKEQAMAVDHLQLNLDVVGEELDRRKQADESLQEALAQERTDAAEIRSARDQERKETRRLAQENAHYVRLVDQLSSQVVEMEEETTKLGEHVRHLGSQLEDATGRAQELGTQLEAKTAVLGGLQTEVKQMAELLETAAALSTKHGYEVQLLIGQLETKESELGSLREQAENSSGQLQNALLESQAEVRRVEEAFVWEKGRMKEQLVEMERLVMALEVTMDPASPHRSQLDEVNTENAALKDRLAVLQQDVQRLEDEISRKKKKVDEMEREHEKSRAEEERLHKENSKYREEVLDLSGRNLQLSGENAELSSRLRADQGAVQMLTERLALVSREQEEGGAALRRLQESAGQHERERAHQQAGWLHEKDLLEREMATAKEKLQRLSEAEAELTGLTLKHQWLQQDKERLQREAEERTQTAEKLQESVLSLDSQAELLRSQLQAVTQETSGHAHEVTSHQRALQGAQDKVSSLEDSVTRLEQEKEQLLRSQKHQEEEAVVSYQEECQSLHLQNQELLLRVTDLQGQEAELRRLTQELQTLKNKQAQLETARGEAQDQALRADAALTLSHAQHARELQQLRDQAGAGSREQLAHLHGELEDERRRARALEDALHTQTQQAGAQLGLQQEQYEKMLVNMQESMEEVESKLRTVRMMLQEKVNQLRDQLSKNSKSDLLLKDLYVENSQLMKALQVTEQRQKTAEKKNFVLEEKVTALNKLLRKMAPASLMA